MKLRDLQALLDGVASKKKLDPSKTFFGFTWVGTISGTTEYIPSRYSSGTRDDPPEVFAKDYNFEREVEANFDCYAIDKKGGKCLIYVGDCEGYDDECDFDAGIEFDGALSSHDRNTGTGKVKIYGLDSAAEELHLTGDEEVVLFYDGKEHRLDLAEKNVVSAEKNRMGVYDRIRLALPFDPSDAWMEWKADQLSDEIEPEEEMADDEAAYREMWADVERDEN